MAEFRLSNFTSGTALTAAELNTGLTYTDYTPTWTQTATITYTKNWARYTRFGKLVIASVKMTATSNGTSGGTVKVTLPVNASSNNSILGHAVFSNMGSEGARFALYDTSTTMVFGGTLTSAPMTGTFGSGLQVTSSPVTTAYIYLEYEAA